MRLPLTSDQYSREAEPANLSLHPELLVARADSRKNHDPSERALPKNMQVHYLEFVCDDVAAQCAALQASHGLSFGPPLPELGNARVAESPDGTQVGVRAPLSEHESPIIRPYLAVDDIASALAKAEAQDAVVAYPPTQQGDTGTWAIYILGDLQVGLWQRPGGG